MNRSLIMHALAAVLATAAAALAWQLPRASSTENLVTVVPGANDKLRQILWHDPSYDVSVKREKDAHDVQVIVRKAAPAGKDAGVRPTAQAYPGSAAATTLLGKLLPLQSSRGLSASSRAPTSSRWDSRIRRPGWSSRWGIKRR